MYNCFKPYYKYMYVCFLFREEAVIALKMV